HRASARSQCRVSFESWALPAITSGVHMVFSVNDVHILFSSAKVRPLVATVLPSKRWSAIQCEDNDPGAQTVRPGAVGPVRGLLGGTSSPAACVTLSLFPIPRSAP